MSRISDRKSALDSIKKIDASPEHYLLIHYSCESFYNITDGRTPRVTSIAIRHIGTGQTESFSMHKTAEQLHIPALDTPSVYDQVERAMLKEYFSFLDNNREKFYIHVNMRDINYGFKAIEHRYKVLGGDPYIIPDAQKIDFARLLIQIYGDNYIAHPRMESLLNLNNIHPTFFLTGTEEAVAFSNHEYVKLHQSTLSKVEGYSYLLQKLINGNLKTKAKWYEIYGVSPQGIFEYCQSRWWIQLIWSVLLLYLGGIIGKYI